MGGGGLIPSSGRGVGFKLMVFGLQLNCSYLHHNMKGVLVEQEHKGKQSEAEQNVAVGSSQRTAAPVSEHSKRVWRSRSTGVEGGGGYLTNR